MNVIAPRSDSRLHAEQVSVNFDGHRVLHAVDLHLPAGEISVFVGANGSGKSTLFRALARLIAPHDGRVTLDGQSISHLPTRQVAQTLALLPQNPIAPDGIIVADLVGRGRYPHLGAFGRWSHGDDDIVKASLDATGVADLAQRRIEELSGGQRQRVWLAMTLAQRADIVLLDEPTTFLDVRHQIDTLELIAELNRDHGTTIGMVLHDLNLASRYADHLFAIAGGRIVATGTPEEVITPETVKSVYDLECIVVPDPVTGSPLVVPLQRQAQRDAHTIRQNIPPGRDATLP
ncbi:MAG TPA: ABC transporter ATP-binding protein [Microbacteriaceae bacterium]|nr:ABC transporter ATP-binding protein [Microbacteriaceae bacterium]